MAGAGVGPDAASPAQRENDAKTRVHVRNMPSPFTALGQRSGSAGISRKVSDASRIREAAAGRPLAGGSVCYYSRMLCTPSWRALSQIGLAGLQLAIAATVRPAAAAEPVLPFRAGTYDEALADAKARELPLFIESWAPW